MRILVLLLLTTLTFSCKKEEVVEKEKVKLIFPTTDNRMNVCCSRLVWAFSEADMLVEIFSDNSFSSASLLHSHTVEEGGEYSIPIQLLPGTTYWLRLSNGVKELETSFTTNELDLSGFIGDHEVKVIHRHADASDNVEFESILKIEPIDVKAIQVSEVQSGLSEALSFLEVVDSVSIWFIRENPDVNIRMVLDGNKVEVKNYPNGLNVTPFWTYDSL